VIEKLLEIEERPGMVDSIRLEKDSTQLGMFFFFSVRFFIIKKTGFL